MAMWESDIRFGEGLRNLPRTLTLSNMSAGLVAALLGVTGPPLLIFQAAENAGLSEAVVGSWFFALFAGGGLFSLLLALAYRQPICGAFSIAGAAFLIEALPRFGLEQAVGAYLLSGVLIVLLAITGGFTRIMALFPAPIIMAMLIGVLLPFGVDIFRELAVDPWLVGPVVAAYLLMLRRADILPPVTVALVLGVALVVVRGDWPQADIPFALTLPLWIMPNFSLDAFLSLSLPLLLLTLTSQNATGIGVLWAQGYRAPVNAVTFATGLLSLVTAPMGGHGVNLATPMTAICGDPSAHPDAHLRYGSAVFNGLLFISFGLMGATLVALIQVLPGGLIKAIAGLALVPVLQQSLEKSFGAGTHRFGCLFALLITASGVHWLGIGAAFWALILATAISAFADRPAKI